MSRARVNTDAERTATMVDLVRRSYPEARPALSHVVIEEVAPGVGWTAANRWADILVLGTWPSKGLTLGGYEIKASRADLKRELADPAKHQALAKWCDTWTLVAWDETVLLDGIPANWGIQITVDDGDGGRQLKVKRKAAVLTPEPWPRSFVCSLVRNAYVQSPGAAYVARAVAAAHKASLRDGRRDGKAEIEALLEPLRRVLFGENRWKWPAEAGDPEKLCRIVAERLTQGAFAAPVTP